MSKKLLMLSDTHFSRDNSLLFEHYDVEKSFDQLIKLITNENPDYIIITGDISQDGSIESYLTAKEKFSQFNCPKFIIYGNHDTDNIKYLLAPDIIMTDYFDIQQHRFIFISSYKGLGFDEGYIGSREIEKLDKYFDKSKQNYIITHHHFIKANSIMDKAILENHNEFCEVLKNYKIKAIFHGHVHNYYNSKLYDINIHANPSTCVQFAILDYLKPEPVIGLRTINLGDKGYDTKVITETL